MTTPTTLTNTNQPAPQRCCLKNTANRREESDTPHQRWETREQLATAMFEWIEAFYNPTRRHSALGYLSPTDYETANTPAAIAA